MRAGLAPAVRVVALLLGVAACASAAACPGSGGSGSPAPLRLETRWWLPADTGAAALSAAVQRLRSAVHRSFADGVLEDGFPRSCTVTEPETRTAPFTPECVEGAGTPDGVLLDAEGRFIRFVPIDFLDARVHLFRIYLLPHGRAAEGATPEDLAPYPYVAIPGLALPEATYRSWLSAIARGIRAAGGEPLRTEAPGPTSTPP